jgi:DNA-binding protein HU-beta
MSKAELVARIAEKAGITKKSAQAALGALVSAIHESLKKADGKIRISDIGTFKVVQRNSRKGVNPRTGKSITIPAGKVPRFTSAKALKDSVKRA